MPTERNNTPINFYTQKKVKKFLTKSINPHFEDHGIKVPFRGVLVGSSGSGKTNTLLNVIAKMGGTFNHIYIYTRAQEPLYDFLKSQLPDGVLSIHYDLDKCREFKEETYYGQSLVIFDDMVNEKDQKCIQELFIRGRKIAGGISILYLTQSYYKVPKIIRSQCQYIFILKVSGVRDLKSILSEYSLGVEKQNLTDMYEYACVSSEFGSFLLIDLDAEQDKTFRKNWKEYL
jgi:hypothetical protein